jgi:hypothetical protein
LGFIPDHIIPFCFTEKRVLHRPFLELLDERYEDGASVSVSSMGIGIARLGKET